MKKSENLERMLADRLPILEKNSLRQPVVEKILNQMINVVNALMDKYGRPDEIRVELARELKQSREERNETYRNLSARERENKAIAERLEQEYRIRATRNNILKWRLFHSTGKREEKINDRCIYCGKQFGITAALTGEEIDIEHIIPKSKLFDDSQSNKILAHRKCNQDKGEMTAYDFMKTKSEAEFQDYLNRVTDLYKSGIINRIKRDRLLMTESKIPKDFINRQLNETRYISRKSIELLSTVCRNVYSTSGSITDYLRNIWGWNDVLMRLQIPKYREAGLTEFEETESGGQIIKREIIKDWSKRNDHRHHAIDALVIACTKQSYINRINNLSSLLTRDEIYKEIEDIDPRKRQRRTLLDNYLAKQQPFTTKQVEESASRVLVSFKPGKRVATYGVRRIRRGRKIVVAQEKIIVPRGALSEETVYGKIRIIEKNKPVKFLFENPELIFKPRIKKLVTERLSIYGWDVKKAIKSLEASPIFLDPEHTIPLRYGTCYKEEYVVKYPVNQLKEKDLDSVVDPVVRERLRERLNRFGNKEKEAFKNLENDPIWYDNEKRIPIKNVRCITGLDLTEPVKKDRNGLPVGFVKPGNNHHIAIYKDENGNLIEHLCTFWHAVERKKYGISVIIKKSDEVLNQISIKGDQIPQEFKDKLPGPGLSLYLSMQQNEMFLIGLQNDEIERLIAERDYKKLSEFLYRVQKLASLYYVFRHHLETELIDTKEALYTKRFYRIQSIKALQMLNPIKVRISLTGEIVRQSD
ncbi:MAG: type II CRISPR RNA-guided endonuclease Cas9 [Bacteroidales bacterium]|nr:type II CRISPR RNA-guided endonuclease Cas9 [Bacteroidales bacterium]